jgi:hypothetical protein
MSRNAVANDSPDASFAGLFERLTGRSRVETAGPESAPNPTSRTGSSARSATRSLVPVAELKMGRGAATQAGTPLSYEKALRLHARRKTGNLALPAMPVSEISPSPRQTSPEARPESAEAAGTATVRPAGSGNAAGRARRVAPSATAPVRASGASRSRPSAAQAQARLQRKPGAKASSRPDIPPQAKARPGARHKNPPANAHRRRDSQVKAATASPSVSSGKSSGATVSASIGKATLASTTGANAVQPARRAVAGTTALELATQPGQRKPPANRLANPNHQANSVHLANLDRRELVLSSADFIDSQAPLALRREIVSLRLTEDEFVRLKDRASESGISVSAYMRSCILDADQLRAQVKQALSEMRALSARPEPIRVQALAPPPNFSSRGRGDWLRLLARSAVLLLSPLFSFRRNG